MGKIRMNCSLITLLALPFFALMAVTAVSRGGNAGNGSVGYTEAGNGNELRILPRRGKQDRAVCSAEGRCLNEVVTCPAECPERNPPGKSQRKACVVDCASACAATCKIAAVGYTETGNGLRMLPRRGRQERAICSAEGRCLNEVVTCPAECPERRPPGMSQRKACVVDCVSACATTCQTLTHKPKAYQTWCNKTNNESLCASMVQSDSRDKLKTSPQGLVVILVSAAQAKANTTRLFINESLQNQTMGDSDNSKAVLNGCLLAYNLDWVNSSLSVNVEQVNDQQRCSDLNDLLRNVVSEVTYDCEWDLPSPMSPTLNQMYENVELLASIVDSARRILSLIGCGAI